MTAPEQDLPLRPDPEAHLVRAGGKHYWMHLPQAGTDYIQKKIADTSEPYEREMLEEMAGRLSPDDLVVDVGANVGNHTLFLAAIAGCRVLALEPNRPLTDAIRTSAAFNGLAERVQVLCLGAGAASGPASLKADNPANLGAQRLVLGSGEVEVRPLDQLGLDAPVRAIKIDVEGMELDVLQGAERLIERDRPLLYVECINDVAFRKLQRWLEPRHYMCWETFNATPTHLFMPQERVSVDERLTRLQGKAFHETYRTGLLLTSVRSRLAQVVEQERRSRDALAQAQSAAAATAERLAAAESDREGWKQRHAEQAAIGREQLEHLARLESQAAGLAQTVREHEAQAAALRQQLQQHGLRADEQARRLQEFERAAAEQAQRLRIAEDRGAEQTQQLRTSEARITEQAKELQASEFRIVTQAKELQASEGRIAGQAKALQAAEDRLAEQARQLRVVEDRGVEQVQQLRLQQEWSTEQARQLRLQEDRAVEQARQLGELQALGLQARAEAAERSARLQELESRSASLQKRLAQVEAERAALQASLSRSAQELQKFRDRAGRLADEQRRLRTLALDGQHDLNELRQEHERVLGSVRYRVGTAVADARSPSGLVKFPVRLWRALRHRPQVASAMPVANVALPAAAAPAIELAKPAQKSPAVRSTPELVEARPAQAPKPEVKRAPVPVPVPVPAPTPQPLSGYRAQAPQGAAALRIAALCSDDAEALFGPDCHWLRLAPEAGLPPLDGVDILLIEARQLLSTIASAPLAQRWRDHLRQAAGAGVATVLWLEGEPQQQPALLEFAGLVHAVVCEDVDAVVLLRRWLGHEKVALWPSAFQPRSLSPFSSAMGELAPVAELGVADAQSQSRLPAGLWPALVRRQLPVVAYSRACHLLFGDLVVSTDDPTQRERAARRWLEDPLADAGRAARALLTAWQDHRAECRLLSLRDLLWPGTALAPVAHVAVVAEVGSSDEVEEAARLVAAQGVSASLWCRLPADTPAASAVGEAIAGVPVRVVIGSDSPLAALPAGAASHVTVLDLSRPWPPGHLAQLLAAALWSGADGAAVAGADTDSSRWTCGPGTALWPATLLTSTQADRWLGPGAEPLARRRVEARLAFVDEVVTLPAGTSAGVPLASLHAAAAAGGAQGGRLDIAPPLALDAAAWMALLPASPPAGVTWAQTPDGLAFEARIPEARVEYAYLERRFDVRDLKPGQASLMQLEGSVVGDVRLVLVFHDVQGHKLSHVMHALNAPGLMAVPEGAATARLALRFQREASGCLRRIELARPRLPARLTVPAAPFLLIAKQYPSYDDLYRFAFVHSRVRGYRERGARVDVFRLGGEPRGSFREFEGVAVQDGDQQRLQAALAGGAYGTVLVHYMDRHVWHVLREHLDRVRVIVWVHGAEIQPWWRRAVNFSSDGERDTVRRGSDQRLAMWREVMASDSPNLRLVFVSAKQAGEAFADLGLFPHPDRYRVISNFIDPAVFPYRSKSAEHRRRILSIRPYASNVYANDLMVRAIEILSQHPLFPSLQFTVIGDGPLFEATVEPLRRFANVTLQQRFLTQHEIADVHREHGIFLVPSRMDSQGVSRDEAMSSGLVPVTTRVAAIPEFVTPDCAFLAEPEDADGLAQAILTLQEDPERFLRMSAAAAAHVQSRSGREQTIDKELALIQDRGDQTPQAPVARPRHHVVVCGDLNLNIMDGSAIWAASLAETLSLLPEVGVTVFCKARIHRTQVISRLLDLTPQVRLVEPALPDRGRVLDVQGMLDGLEVIDRQQRVDGWVLRGFDLCTAAAARPAFRGRLWAYLTDIPQRDEDITPENSARIVAIIECCSIFFCQTPQFEAFVHRHWPMSQEKTRILSPMVPPATEHPRPIRRNQPFRVAYAGKFAPLWGIRELFRSYAALRVKLADAELHVYGDKIHNPPDDPGYRDEIRARLEGGEGLAWHGAVDRAQLMQALAGMDVCWAYRDPQFERSTHELSTKVLEYASIGVPIILARSEPNEEALGRDYPLFAVDEADAASLLAQLASSTELCSLAVRAYSDLARRYSFDAVAKALVREGLVDTLDQAVQG